MNAPDPLTPADCDLRGMAYMPFFGDRLLTSDFDAISGDTAWRAGVTLWWRAWTQVPAASLPSDDMVLARLAGFGRDMDGWMKVKLLALHGFVLCSDGRIYHRVLAELARDVWTKRQTWREKKRRQRGGQSRDNIGDMSAMSPSSSTVMSQVLSPQSSTNQSPSLSTGDKPVRERERESVSKEETPVVPLGDEQQVTKPNRRKPKRALPDDWVIPDDWLTEASAKGLNAETEAERFEAYHRARGEPSADWHASWRTWLLNAVKFADRDGRKPAAVNGHAAAPASEPWDPDEARRKRDEFLAELDAKRAPVKPAVVVPPLDAQLERDLADYERVIRGERAQQLDFIPSPEIVAAFEAYRVQKIHEPPEEKNP